MAVRWRTETAEKGENRFPTSGGAHLAGFESEASKSQVSDHRPAFFSSKSSSTSFLTKINGRVKLSKWRIGERISPASQGMMSRRSVGKEEGETI
jgi:hypothetical protein